MKKQVIFFAVCTFIFMLFPIIIHASNDSMVRIGLQRSFSNRASITVSNTQIIVGHGTTGGFLPIQTLNSATGFIFRNSGGQVTVSSGNQVIFTFENTTLSAQIRVQNELISMGDYQFRGYIEFRPSGGNLSAINVISIEEYLWSVVPAEMPPSFHIEALRAQAVAARTYTEYRRLRSPHSHQGFDLCDTHHCQVSRGVRDEHPETTRAVNDTRGLMMYHNNRVILAAYFSSSGGGTDNSENVWVETRPYLRGVPSIAEHEPMIWTRTYTWAQITNALNNTGTNIGTANGISITQVGQNGRPLEITIHATNGSRAISREAISSFFGHAGQSLPSRNFTIAGATPNSPVIMVTDGWTNNNTAISNLQVVDHIGVRRNITTGYIFDGHSLRPIHTASTIASGGTGITLSGRGWGHGVGMSQRGAEGMARLGYNFRQILHHYYTGVVIR